MLLLLTATIAAGTNNNVAFADQLERFTGQYVGTAQVLDPDGAVIEERHMDIEIARHKNDGLQIHWYNVILVDGRRDLPGVRRNSNEVILVPHTAPGYYVESDKSSPFREKRELAATKGDPIRWAVIDENTIYFYSFQKLPDDRYEMQTYIRRMNDVGLELDFERIVDGKSRRVIKGKTVRAQ